MEESVVVIDNGATNIRFGFAGQPESLKVIGNYLAKSKGDKKRYIGDISEIRDKSSISFTRPFDRGYPINWNLEKNIWDKLLANTDTSNSSLLLTTPIFCPDTLFKIQNEVIFEDYGFKSLYTTSAPVLSQYNAKQEYSNSFGKSPCHLVIDTGYSFTHIVPFFDDRKINYGVKRCSIGGKHLTNYLKETISYRYWNMMDENYLVNLIKEKLCYVSLDFLEDLKITKKRGELNTIKLDYVLPDYINNHTGYIKEKPMEIDSTLSTTTTESNPIINKESEQLLTMNNERISIPELLFTPSDIGIPQAGVAEAVIQSINSCHPDLHSLLYNNIVITGGNTLIPNYKERLYQEIRKMAPIDFEVNVIEPNDPMNFAWQGGCKFGMSSNYKKYVVTKEQYEEFGHIICKRKFYN